MTTSFFVPRAHFSGDVCDFPPEEAHHASRVLRHSSGDTVRVVDGEGSAYIIRLIDVGKNRVSGQVVEHMPDDGEPSTHVTIAAALLKQRGRYETFLEKAVELGVSAIVPLITARTEKGGLKLERSENLLQAAMKQSGRSLLPDLRPSRTLPELLSEKNGDELWVVCHESAEGSPEVISVLREEAPSHVTILIGPEGGFTEAEIGACRAAGLKIARLGPRRLRAETAAMVAAAACMFYDSEITQK